ncbi:MAG: hypothetical protein F6K18_19295 [Okeania sp. SIO2C2]|uniref:hypothetical protein n=1 Tax=Okeania sp. SIO2C2 TaxID=2607787 RepID=UPI0013BD34F1|nr:hypothetical protein [Okeania sp. SIO2C2]NEP88808.1 hypothetical protein [Okeania sp. SIO2C2]
MAQVQFDPQIIGFIEGAPPVPSENLTVGPEDYQDSYDGTTAVEVTEVNSYNYSYAHSRSNSAQNGFEQEAKNGGEIDLSFVLAPLGVGKTIDIDLSGAGTGATQLDSDNSYTDEKAIEVGKTTTENTTQQLKGYWQPLPDPDNNYKPPAYNPVLGPRYVPENIGLALVISKTADVFALRFEHNNALFSYSIRPNQDIPPDFNLIPFKINPQYTKQGTLDGKIGYDEQGAIFLDPNYPTASDYGEYSYFKPREAYNLKEEINRKEKELAAYYENFNVAYGEGWAADVGIDYAANLGASLIAGGIGFSQSRRSPLTVTSGLGTDNPVTKTKSAGGFGAWFTSQISALASLASTTSDIGKAFERENNKDQALPDKFAKQNIVNTYVWSADGGFYSQSSETTQSRTESYEGSFNFSFQSGATSELEMKFEFSASEFKSTGFSNLGVSLTRSRAKEQQETFEVQITFDLSNNIQKYDYSEDPSEPDPVYDADSKPVLCPGKVDAYRFMTFFLQEDNENHEQLFNKVIDPIWLNESNDKNAIALRGARNDGKAPSCWRVMHRVTFVSRILPEIGAETPPLEREMKDLDISSYYELIKRLEPFVVSSADSYDNLLRAVNNTLAKYAPSLMSYNKDITLILCYYYGVDLPSELEDDLAVLSQTYSSVPDYSLPEEVETQEN